MDPVRSQPLPSGERIRPRHRMLLPHETLLRAAAYLDQLRSGHVQAGRKLDSRIGTGGLRETDPMGLLASLCDTKVPCIFAESAVAGNGTDWNATELGLLGDISCAVRVNIHDDGTHSEPVVHEESFAGMLVFTSGALLRASSGTPADWDEVVAADGSFSRAGYLELYRRRLLPGFDFINRTAASGRRACVTIPGMGCGQFAGRFRGRLGEEFRIVLETLLAERGARWPNIGLVRFDPYSECRNDERTHHGICFRVRPLRALGGMGRPQLCRPEDYAEGGEDLSKMELFSWVAWDHVSWPGNDFYRGHRATDDGVKAAATDCMAVLTGVEGRYSSVLRAYLPPKGFETWEDVVLDGVRTRGLRFSDAIWEVG